MTSLLRIIIPYRRFEYHGLKKLTESICRIYRYGYINDKEVPLNSVKEWENIPTETIIPNVDRLLFGRYKCPTVNRDNINSVQGVTNYIRIRCCVQKAKDSYVRFNEEYVEKPKVRKYSQGKQLFKKDTE